MSDVLARICDIKRADVERRKVAAPQADLEKAASEAPPARGFVNAIERSIEGGRFALIAEIKKASPSKGL